MKTFIYAVLAAAMMSATANAQQSSFGTYTKIGNYAVQAPFNGKPETTEKSNCATTTTRYEFSGPMKAGDVNTVYAVDVYKMLDKMTAEEALEYMVVSHKMSYIDILGGKLVSEEKITYNGKPAHKIKINKGDGSVMTSVLVNLGNEVVRIYVLSPEGNSENKKIQDFINEVKIG